MTIAPESGPRDGHAKACDLAFIGRELDARAGRGQTAIGVDTQRIVHIRLDLSDVARIGVIGDPVADDHDQTPAIVQIVPIAVDEVIALEEVAAIGDATAVRMGEVGHFLSPPLNPRGAGRCLTLLPLAGAVNACFAT